VTAIDIYPAELDDEPENLECQIWDLNDKLTDTYRTSHYDLIHSRCVGPGIRKDRWRGYVRDISRLLARGGWVQMAEFYYNIQSDSGRLTTNHALYRWGLGYRTAMERDRDPRVGPSLKDKLVHAGLSEVNGHTMRVPIGDWPTGEWMKACVAVPPDD
jgi:hypothetical protein